MFFTRIPVPFRVKYSEENMGKALMYLPFMGWIVGGVAALVFYLSSFVFSPSLAIIFSMISSILLTGALHEDGFADVCDGFGGGHAKERILEIMKDSSSGVYAVIGLAMILLTKFFCLSDINTDYLPFVLIGAHSLSRYMATLFGGLTKYVRKDDSSKSKHLIKPLNAFELIFAGVIALLPMLLLPSYNYLLIIPFVAIIALLFARYFIKRIGGQTGDCLGAMQQITEIAFYLGVILVGAIL